MSSSTQKIWEIISNDLTIKKSLMRRLINVRALAKFIIKEYNISASLDSAITAIRRYEPGENLKEHFTTISKALKGSAISTRADIACLSLRENSCNAKHLQGLLSDTEMANVRISKGSEFLKVLVEQKELARAREKLSESVILEEEKGLAEIVVFLNKESQHQKGIYARIMNEVSAQDINIREVITCLPEVIIYVKKEDLVKAHDALFKLCNSSK